MTKKAPEEEGNKDFPEEDRPPIWNPTAAALWSLVFSPVFGAYMQAKNWEILGFKGKATSSRRWAFGCAGFFLASLAEPSILFGFPPGLIAICFWFVFSGAKQILYVRERFGEDYGRMGWGIPVSLALACLAVFLLSCMLVIVLCGAVGFSE